MRTIATLFLLLLSSAAASKSERPNILVIFGDDIGMWNISAYHRGMLGSRTPNIDRIASDGALFTDHYAEQSCTAGRAAFITGQHPVRTGLLKVGRPGSSTGLQHEDPTLAELLKPLGYATAQVGKNHLGDRDEHLPTQHGFDFFYGNLYHLNAEEEPETNFYPADPEFRRRYAPRGVIRARADGVIEDTGPLTRSRMETIDGEFISAGLKFIEDANKRAQPFFLWVNTTRMHVWTRLAAEWEGKTGYGLYADGLAEHDFHVGLLLDKLDELEIADDTIVLYSTDNGVETFTFPDGGVGPFKGDKGTTWEGGFRVPALVRWPGNIEAGTVINDMFSHQDWLPTLMAAVGKPEIKRDLLNGYHANEKTFRVHIDGVNQLELLRGKGKGRRESFFYFDDEANLNAVRWKEWKLIYTAKDDWFYGQRQEFTVPKVVNLRLDPFEKSLDSKMYFRWATDQLWLYVPLKAEIQKFIDSFREFPPRQRIERRRMDRVYDTLFEMSTSE